MSIYSKNDQLPIDDGVETTEDCENIYLIERQLFLRAALQLLDERDSLLQNGASSSHNASSSSRTAFRSDVIRFGRLKKANKRNALSSMAPRVWKSKVVEIKYGIFYYEDEAISKSDFIDNVWRKSIPLSASTTTCREVKGKGANANCIFQLSTTGGSKRTFLASSQTDRDAWIQAIYTAMSSCPSQASSTPVAAVAASVEKSLDKKGSFSLFKGATKQRIRAIGDSAWLTLPEATDLLALQSTSSLPGPAAKFAQDVTAYCAEQTKFTAAATAEDFQQAVHNLRDQRLSIRVPVFFVKVSFMPIKVHCNCLYNSVDNIDI